MLNEDRTLPLLPAQEGVLFAEQAHGRPGSHNLALALGLGGPLDRDALRAALQALTARHEALRVGIVEHEGRQVQRIAPAVTVPLEEAELTAPDRDTEDRLLAERFTEAQDRPFRLDRAPLLRAVLFRLGPERHALLLVLHHGVADGTSLDVLARDLETLYEAFATGRPDPLAPPAPGYAEHVGAALSAAAGRRRERALAHWRAELDGAPATLDLPMARLTGTTARHAATHRRDLPAATVAGLRRLAGEHRATLFSVLAAGAFAVFSRYTGEPDLVLGVPLSTRLAPGSEEVVGLAVNTMPLRVKHDPDEGFLPLLGRVQGRTLQAMRHNSVPFHELVQDLNPPRSPGRQPVFQLGLNHVTADPAPATRAGVLVERLPVANATAAFELMLTFVEGDEDAWVYAEYDTGRFAADAVRTLTDHLANLLGAVAADPATPLCDLELLDAGERARVLHGWNDTAAPLSDDSIPALFARQAARHASATAVVHGGDRLTYRELDARSGRLARLLTAHGVREGTFVGISLPRGADMVVAVLAVLKTGAAYVPLDPAYPPDRLAFMVEDARPALVVTASAVAGALPAGDGTPPLLVLDDPAVRAGAEALPDDAFRHDVPADSTAYVIYTSGSTGRPKGVVVTHRNVVNLAAWAGETFGAGLDRVLAATSLNFDVSVFEILGPLLNGGSIEVVRDLLEIGERGSWHGTLVSGVPSVLARLIADGGPDLRAGHLVLAGEALTPRVAAQLRAAVPGARLVNAYGPTEATVYASSSAADDPGGDSAPPIGRPLRNTRLYVLDDRMRPVPTGVPGELYIGGAGLAQGYLNRPELTEERFVPDPFGAAGSRLYRSGDVVLRRPDGQLEYLGRADDQVKLRGFRVEPGEIEAVLAGQPEVAQAVVVVHVDGLGERRLVGYVTPAPGAVPDPARLRAAAARALPEYMVPSVVTLDELPLSPSGKLDRGRLPDPGFRTSAGRPPETPEERSLAALFADMLGVAEVSAADGFFDLGGHSLLAIRLVRRIREATGAELTVRDVFETPTVQGLAQRLGRGARAGSGGDFGVLLPLRRTGSQPPLFCVHPGFALGWSYAALMRRLDADQPVYGLQARGVGAEEELPATFDELAADYLEHIRSVQPHGPYRLLGWSFGGLVVHALATRLQAEGEEVQLLAMLDTVMVGTDEELEPEEQRRLIETETAAVRQVVPDEDRLLRVVENLIRVRSLFRPGRFEGDVLHFTAAEEPGRTDSVSDPWRPYVAGRVEEHRIACSHLQMMDARPAQEIGDLLAKTLARFRAPDASGSVS
ncbi:amino acid adenylation domain-containing protein [Streptomyces sp. NPDC013953]|uniref:non-ribosomal peptide synthetase n=1 Tax=Streptomyces sp. NPDC013953 TaxID=3364868 RepID=UPI0036FC5734